MEKPAFGGIIKEADKRNYDLDVVNQHLGSAIPTIKSNNDYSMIPVDYQGKQPACGYHAGAFFKNIKALKDGDASVKHGSPRYTTTKAYASGKYSTINGTDINSIFSIHRNNGICSYDRTGNDVTLPLDTYATIAITSDMETEASKNQTESEAFIYGPTWQQICQTIDIHGGCVLLMRVGENMYKGRNGISSWNEADILPLSPANYAMGSGHFVVAINYDENYIYFRNSWGETWGRRGDGYFGKDYLKYVNAIGVAVDKKNVPPQAVPANLQNVIDHSPSWTQTQIQVFLNWCRKLGSLK